MSVLLDSHVWILGGSGEIHGPTFRKSRVCEHSTLPLVWGPCTLKAYPCPHPEPDSKPQLGDPFLLGHTLWLKTLSVMILLPFTQLLLGTCVRTCSVPGVLAHSGQETSRPGLEVLPSHLTALHRSCPF